MDGLSHVAVNTSDVSASTDDPNCFGMSGEYPSEPLSTTAFASIWFRFACS